MVNQNKESLQVLAQRIIKSNVLVVAPEHRPQVDDVAARRLLMNQLYIMGVDSNTRRLVEDFIWPSKADKLVGALHHRITELYDKTFTYTSSQKADWLNTVSSLIDGAAVSVLAIAMKNDPLLVAQMQQLLTQLASLAGTLRDEDQESSEAA